MSSHSAGSISLALDQWREEGTTETVLDVLRKTELRWGDQDALNIVANDRWYEVPRRWNVQTFDVEENSLAWALWRSDVEQAIAEPADQRFVTGEGSVGAAVDGGGRPPIFSTTGFAIPPGHR